MSPYDQLIADAVEQVSETESGGICRMTEDCRPELGGCFRCGRVAIKGIDIARVDLYVSQNLVSFTMATGCGKSSPCRVYIKNVEVSIHD
jgi:hypothetical protein